eukprot:1253452-Amphidinium_carterae.1
MQFDVENTICYVRDQLLRLGHKMSEVLVKFQNFENPNTCKTLKSLKSATVDRSTLTSKQPAIKTEASMF